MSERKVLNKYYPPDFDPSKIPRSKERRNSTFTIRLMAPCNMRCTTCGEYIYKGRKFNSRKEDVDDMNHLGLRIFRFYIKCTACLSEISFRTDPANTDYVLEAGATRNFEALSKAEKQAEAEDRAHKEELENNPMKLLEERTEASKNEMERMEALEELQELNKRTVKVDYDTMLSKYDKIRAQEAKKREEEDEEFIKAVFGKFGKSVGAKVKRILDDDDNSDEEAPRTKFAKPTNPTDILSEQSSSTSKDDKSLNKNNIASLVKPKSVDSKKKNLLVKPKNSLVKPKTALVNPFVKPKSVVVEPDKKSEPKPDLVEPKPAQEKKDSTHGTKPNSLGLLANYSDSDENSD